jgi:hypothetical protein
MSALQFAGYLIDQQTGVSLGEIFNPELDSSSSLSGELLYWLGTAVFLLIGGATLIIRTLIDSYLALPLGYALLPDATFELLWKLVGQSFVLVLQISAPVLTTMTLVALAMGLMSHTVPQLNVLIIGFPVRTIVGLAILLIALARMSERRVSKVVRQGDGLSEVRLQAEGRGDGPCDLGHLEGMGQAGTVVIALMGDEDLGLLLQTPEGRGVNDPVPVAGEGGPGTAFRLRMAAPAGGGGALRKGGTDDMHASDGSMTAAPSKAAQPGSYRASCLQMQSSTPRTCP